MCFGFLFLGPQQVLIRSALMYSSNTLTNTSDIYDRALEKHANVIRECGAVLCHDACIRHRRSWTAVNSCPGIRSVTSLWPIDLHMQADETKREVRSLSLSTSGVGQCINSRDYYNHHQISSTLLLRCWHPILSDSVSIRMLTAIVFNSAPLCHCVVDSIVSQRGQCTAEVSIKLIKKLALWGDIRLNSSVSFKWSFGCMAAENYVSYDVNCMIICRLKIKCC